jgi:hypothetical protein
MLDEEKISRQLTSPYRHAMMLALFFGFIKE